MNNYYSKYLKYKNKYIKLKELRYGGLLPLINEHEQEHEHEQEQEQEIDVNINSKCEYNNSMMIH